ncbi:hypothetical protein NliqN6_4641 [Naganishia liquefaciens]|uniref:Uncharacterized protein n=1 Tax=Naganishia liquefaciens TaxID=104408 RepID=A0A8H3YG22_9TREE|nr:hypothetical protein NliqN6_4641 [Naganishia liquefaciens]
MPPQSTPKFHPRSTSPGTRPASQLAKHGKYVLLGAFGCWWLDIRRHVLDDILGTREAAQRTRGYKMLVAALALQTVTVVLFLYLIVFLPWIRGIIPNYPSWQRSQRLRIIMPLLTSTILTGFIALVLALIRGTPLGAFRSILAATSVYLLTFGTLGLVPSPGLPSTAASTNADDKRND